MRISPSPVLFTHYVCFLEREALVLPVGIGEPPISLTAIASHTWIDLYASRSDDPSIVSLFDEGFFVG